MSSIWIFIVSLIIFNQYISTEAACYFPQDYQGEFAMQNTFSKNTVHYATVNITATGIPIWGNCHRRIGNNFILVVDLPGSSCIRCLHLKLQSKNVLQVLSSSKEVISKCYTNEELAEANCPTEESLRTRSTTELILFKMRGAEGKHISREYCPLDGRYSFTYRSNDHGSKKDCGHESTVDSCPSGSSLTFKYRQCSFGSLDLKFDCLGHWEGVGGQRYLALADSRQSMGKPQYRCALYKPDPSTGLINIAISRDSTCTGDLHNATHGYENYVLRPSDERVWPPEVSYSSCSFPDWMRGTWEHIRVEDNTITYKDHSTFKTYTIKCVAMMESNDKYSVLSRTQCGEEQFNCMRIQKRSNNILEFQLGANFSDHNDIFELCADTNFQDDAWITQGRVVPGVELACPISGEYTGMIPDTNDLCAKLWSDCRAPELMYYQVSDCATNEIYEEREYRCLGHWRERDLLYTYTQRHDVAAGTYECFVGSIVSSKEDIYITEAGEHCQRRIDPLQYGMKLVKKGLYSCIERVPTTKRPTTPRTQMPTKPWNIGVPFPTIPDYSDNNINSALGMRANVFSCLFLVIVTIVMSCKW
ncbi:uncharacterized protein [Atheta coriaria]|uniref:uncharacterized protein n=1 Tax=Dalotia coriaria TaxID=877792 RepID=UPI0031F3606F